MAAVERHGRCGRQKGSREISEKASPFAQVRDDGRYGLGWRLRRQRGKINRTW